MSLNPRPTNSPRKGSVMSSVKYLVERGRQASEIIKSVSGKFKTVSKASINQAIEYWQEARQAAQKIEVRSQARKITLQGLPTRSAQPSMIRLTVSARLNLPSERQGARTGGFVVDIPVGMSASEAKDYARRVILADLWEKYQNRSPNKGAFSKRLGSLTIREIEAI